MNNFNTLVAIMAGLRSEWVDKAMRRFWPRVGMWESRMFKDLKVWTNDDDDFKFMRDSISNMLDAKPLDVNSHASVTSTMGTDDQSGKGRSASEIKVLPIACIPFIGSQCSLPLTYIF
jgi:Gdp/GTP exchange factor required for growth at low temperatures